MFLFLSCDVLPMMLCRFTHHAFLLYGIWWYNRWVKKTITTSLITAKYKNCVDSLFLCTSFKMVLGNSCQEVLATIFKSSQLDPSHLFPSFYKLFNTQQYTSIQRYMIFKLFNTQQYTSIQRYMILRITQLPSQIKLQWKVIKTTSIMIWSDYKIQLNIYLLQVQKVKAHTSCNTNLIHCNHCT